MNRIETADEVRAKRKYVAQYERKRIVRLRLDIDAHYFKACLGIAGACASGATEQAHLAVIV